MNINILSDKYYWR